MRLSLFAAQGDNSAAGETINTTPPDSHRHEWQSRAADEGPEEEVDNEVALILPDEGKENFFLQFQRGKKYCVLYDICTSFMRRNL